MKKTVAGLGVSFMVFASLAWAQEPAAPTLSGELDAAEKFQSHAEIVQFIRDRVSADPGQALAAAKWLQEHSIGQTDPAKTDAVYFLAYSDILGNMRGQLAQAGRQDEVAQLGKLSLAALYMYEALSARDAARCEDETVPASVNSITQVRLSSLQPVIASASKKDLDAMGKNATTLDLKLAARPASDAICSYGVARMRDMLAQPGVETHAADTKEGTPARTEVVPPQGYRYAPKFVADDVATQRTNAARAELAKKWEERSAAARK
ncbi:MAG TPA: hypothetical protein VEF76_13710 [Patescibacteria group bacterium]|nr:hypothetical protein [Patescibacteria group bacterium]